MNEFELELKRGQYLLSLVKILPQRPEYMASALRRNPKHYPYKFVTIHVFDKIPKSFWEIYHVIIRKGKLDDGTIYGTYALTPHGRGKKYGNPPNEARYRAGCKFHFTPTGLKIFDVRFSHKAFKHLLNSAVEVDSYIKDSYYGKSGGG